MESEFDRVLDLWKRGTIEVIDDGEWKQSETNQYRQTIVRFNGRFFGIRQSRIGSLTTEWLYIDPSVSLVNPKAVNVIIWEDISE